MKKKSISVFLSLFLGIGLMAGCASKGTPDTVKSDDTYGTEEETESLVDEERDEGFFNQTSHLNIALQPIPGYLPITVLQDKGWVEEALKEAGYEDISVNYTEYESGPSESEAVAAGSQDIGVMGNVPTISGIANGQHVYILGVAYNGEKTEAVIVPKNSSVSSLSDLKGKKVGMVVGSIAQDFFYRLLEKEGIESGEIECVDVSLNDQIDALSSGMVDAIVTWQPTLAKAETQGVGRILVDGSDVYKCENLISGNVEYIELNPEIVQIFFQQYARAVKEVSDNKEAYAKEYADKYGLDASIIEAILSDINYQVSIGEDDILDFQSTADWLYETESVTKQLDVADAVNDRFANDASIASYLD